MSYQVYVEIEPVVKLCVVVHLGEDVRIAAIKPAYCGGTRQAGVSFIDLKNTIMGIEA